MATIRDVAAKAGVSKATVSRVLNNKSVVNSRTRERILGVIRELDYTPSFLAKGMRNQNSGTIGVVVPDFNNLYYSEFLTHVQREIRLTEYTSIICSVESDIEQENEYVNRLVERQQIEGLILCWYFQAMEDRLFLRKLSRKLPIVLMDESADGLPVSSVYSDHYKGLRQLTEHLIGKGHKRIAIIKSIRRHTIGDMRFRGYLDAMREAGLAVSDDLIQESEWTVPAGYEACNRLLDGRVSPKPTAIVAANDLIAIGVLMNLNERKLSVPDTIAIAGYDDISLAKAVYPPLTTVREHIEKKAKIAVQLLIERIKNSRKRNREVVLEPELVVRGST
jgi:DNA-binding LacI/PurR family transcriptional regulator